MALFMEGLDTTIVNTAAPAIAEGLQVTPLSLKAAVKSYILSLAVCIPVRGWMADRFGRRRVLSIAVAISPPNPVLPLQGQRISGVSHDLWVCRHRATHLSSCFDK